MTAAPLPGTVTAAGSGADALLAVTDLRVEFSGVHAVAGATFAVGPGTITGLIGPNGAGKSTTLKLIAGSEVPTGGRVRYEGQDITGHPVHEVARHGLIRTFQLSSEFARLTVLENLVVAAPGQRGATLTSALLGKRYWRAQQADLIGRASALLAEFGLSQAADQYAGELSGGQKRLLEIMRALMAEPRMLLLDEPLAGVNPTLRGAVTEHLCRLRDQGLTMLMVEHELAAVERCCDSVIVMAAGRVLTEGTMAEIRANKEVVDAYLLG
ncbi:MAG TPA: ABC transporter ATP-binding protein [Streptosporangiaceae bacterium]|nr:ABC transporter ATP-binding protein [Streptosporangiaceae bacterium]